MNINEAIQLWKERNIQRCEMEFSCGGDSMGDTEFIFYTNEGTIQDDDDLESYFDEAVYKNVEFYVNSDGEYLGEHGTVTITLDSEDGTKFIYDKESVSEMCQRVTETTEITISLEEEALFDKISLIEIQDGQISYTFTNDVILSEEEIELMNHLEDRIVTHCTDYQFNFNEGEPADNGEWSAELISAKNGFLKIDISTSFYVYTENY